MSSPDSERERLAAEILRATGELGAGRAALSQAVADRHGLATTDVAVLRQLAVEGAVPVGRIGELTSLTTGATTRLIDRLEQAGYVRRLPDPADRRRVLVEPVAERCTAVVSAFDPMDEAIRRALDPLPDALLVPVRDFLDDCAAAARAQVEALSGTAAGGSGSVAAPVASATRGRLVFVTGSPNVRISSDATLGAELYRARFEGAIPSARVRDGVVTIRFPRFAWFDWRMRIGDNRIDASTHWRKDSAEVVLNAALPWRIEFRGGSTTVSADLAGVRLEALEMAGGSGSLSLTLGEPVGVVPLRIAGGAHDVAIRRPAGAPVRLAVHGGYRSATLDGVKAWHGGTIASAGADSASDRYEIEVSGGANRVVVTPA